VNGDINSCGSYPSFGEMDPFAALLTGGGRRNGDAASFRRRGRGRHELAGFRALLENPKNISRGAG
jgi:hypothetical protein